MSRGANPSERAADGSYTSTAKAFHWLTVALLLVQFGIAWTMPEIKRGTGPTGLISWHLSMGLLILLLIAARLVWRLTHPAPPAPTDLPSALRALSRVTHYAFYAILMVLPLLGWANASARGWAVNLFGGIPLPSLVAKGSSLGMQAGDVHMTLATILLVLIGLHVAGALYHALVLRDRTLQRMLPGRAA